MNKKAVPLSAEEQAENAQSSREYQEWFLANNGAEDRSAGSAALWDFNYSVELRAILENGQEILRVVEVNAGSVWEACIFARRAFRGLMADEGLVWDKTNLVNIRRI